MSGVSAGGKWASPTECSALASASSWIFRFPVSFTPFSSALLFPSSGALMLSLLLNVWRIGLWGQSWAACGMLRYQYHANKMHLYAAWITTHPFYCVASESSVIFIEYSSIGKFICRHNCNNTHDVDVWIYFFCDYFYFFVLNLKIKTTSFLPS